jgi:hypothetical protein
VIVVIASRWDAVARKLVAGWSPHDARVLTAEDLARPGWCVAPGSPAAARAVVEGKVVAPDAITGVLTRIPAIAPRELPMLAEDDRAYAATEMTAFLVHWLSGLRCPVLNRPSPPSLCGPSWRSEQWTLVGARLGLAVEARVRRTPAFDRDARTPAEGGAADAAELVHVTVVGERCIGADAAPEPARAARLLAQAAAVRMLAVVFRPTATGWSLVDAHRWVDVRDDAVADALLEVLQPAPHTALAEVPAA